MSNMGDCRFENTCCDLLDCLDALRQYQPVSESEYRAAFVSAKMRASFGRLTMRPL